MKTTTRRRREGGRRLSDVAYTKLRADILEAVFPPGAHMKESSIAATLKMGRTPVREALTRLASDGLVQCIPTRGFFVTSYSLEEIEQIVEIRSSLECVAARLACRNGCPEDTLAAMEQTCVDLLTAAEQGDSRQAGRHDVRFHQLLIAMARSPRLEAAIAGAHVPVLMTASTGGPHRAALLDNARSTVEGHRAILQHLRAGHAAEVERWLHETIRDRFRSRLGALGSAPERRRFAETVESAGHLGDGNV
jgi:GntR family transcriptional regulator, vanillate catabolism transcriptional regulator